MENQLQVNDHSLIHGLNPYFLHLANEYKDLHVAIGLKGDLEQSGTNV